MVRWGAILCALMLGAVSSGACRAAAPSSGGPQGQLNYLTAGNLYDRCKEGAGPASLTYCIAFIDGTVQAWLAAEAYYRGNSTEPALFCPSSGTPRELGEFYAAKFQTLSKEKQTAMAAPVVVEVMAKQYPCEQKGGK